MLLFSIFFHECYQIANSLDPHQDRHFAGHARYKKCLQMLSTEDTRKQSVKTTNKDNMINIRPGVMSNNNYITFIYKRSLLFV